MNKTTIAVLSLLLPAAVFMPVSPAPAGSDYLRVTKPYADSMRLAVPIFQNEGAERPDLAAEISNLLIANLALPGYFIPADNTDFVREQDEEDRTRGRIDLGGWSTLGVEALVKGTYRVDGDRVSVSASAFSVSRGRQLYGKRYSGDLSRWRWIVHTISDEIIEALTGEKGFSRTRIAFVATHEGERKIHLMEASGGEVRKIDSGRGFALYPSWDPDGQSLAYTSYSSGFPWLVLDNLRTGKRRVVSAQPGMNALSSISPDGRSIALTLSRDGNPEIYLVRLDGTGGLRRLTNSPAVECSPSWSPDGNRIAFVSDRTGTPQIYVMNSDGSNVSRLTRRGRHNVSPSWSPRGDLIAYSSLIDGKFEICAVNVNTGEETRITSDPYRNEEPSWAPDGRHLVYSSRRYGRNNLMVIDIRNPRPIQITDGRDCTNPAWSPIQAR